MHGWRSRRISAPKDDRRAIITSESGKDPQHVATHFVITDPSAAPDLIMPDTSDYATMHHINTACNCFQ